MMNGRSILFLSLEDIDGKVTTAADVELLPAGGTDAIPLRFDERRLQYISEPVEAGDYILIVRAEGYVTEEVRLELTPPSLSTSVILGREGQPYYIDNGRRTYFEPDGERIGALVREPEELGAGKAGQPAQARTRSLLPTLERLRALQAADGPELATPRGLLVFDRERLQSARDKGEASLEQALSETPEVIDAGPLLRGHGRPLRFLSSQIEVETEEGVSPEEVEALIAPFGLRILERYRHDPRVYLLQSTRLAGPEFGALPERLMELPAFRRAESRIAAPKELLQHIVPGDPDFSLQFQAFVTRLPEAWHRLDPTNSPGSFGSADVVVAIHDGGIGTTGNGAVIVHPEFSGTVAGGALSTQPGLSNKKVLFTFDFGSLPMIRGNDATAGSHGSWVTGVITAAQDGLNGVVGGAANTRACTYIFSPSNSHDGFVFRLMGGLDPQWQQGGVFGVGQPFPPPLGTGRNPVPGAGIVNCSHSYPVRPDDTLLDALLKLSLFGRNRRGTLVFAAAGNEDGDLRTSGLWAENTNVIRVAASSLDVREEEVRMNYSCFSDIADPVLDFSAPSESQNVFPTVHEPPQIFGFISVDRTTASGDLPTTAAARTDLTNAPAAGTRTLKSAGLASFAVGQTVIVRDKVNPLHSEVHVIAAKPTADTIDMSRDLGFSYAGPAEVIRLSGNNAYSRQFGGTSAASPQAAAIAALMLSARPALTWLEVRELMRRTALPIGLRQRGSRYTAGPSFRYRWLDPVGLDLVDANGMLDIAGGNRTIVAGPVHRGDRLLTLNDTTGIVPRQALLIGVETKLNGAHPKPPPDERVIDVDRSDDFEIGDTLFIGKDVQTVLIETVVPPSTVLWVQSVDGIEPGDRITVGKGATAEILTVTTVQRMSTAAVPPAASTGDAETGLNLAAPAANAHNRGEIVRIDSAQFEGPFTVTGKAAGSLTLNNPVTAAHPGDRVVRKQGTEARAVIRVLAGSRVEIDPLGFDHPFNAAGVEPVRIGRVASYSLGFGRGRLDALEAVDAARSYSHDDCDLVIRNFLADDGVINVGAQEVESPDIWVRNDAPTTLATLPSHATAGPHQAPEITIDPAIHIGTGRNDLEVSGVCTSAAEVTFTIEIDHTAAVDTFKWSRNGAAPTAGVAITGAEQALGDGVSIRFATVTGHTHADRWIVRARQVIDRYLHVRVRNRGHQPYFARSTFAPATSPDILDVARSRILLSVSDGYPVCRFASVAALPGADDLQVVAKYTGINPRALYTIEITAIAGGGDKFLWYRDGTLKATVTLTAGTLEQTLDDNVKVRFGSHTGHAIGDCWNLYARAGADASLNLDHYWDVDPPVAAVAGAFNPASGRAGTRSIAFARINGLAAGGVQIDSAPWPEALRPPTNSPNNAKPTHPRRLFILGEAVPHDGALMGFTAKTNNNISFREIVFAKLRFSDESGANPADIHVDVDSLGHVTTKKLRVEVRTTAGTFAVERVRLKLTARKGAIEESSAFRYSGAWGWDTVPAWATVDAPIEAIRPDGLADPATGEHFDIHFDCTYTIDKSFNELVIEAQILSDFRDFPVASATHTIAIYTIAPLPTGTGAAAKAAELQPASFVFADMASLTQTALQAFGPVEGSPTTRYRATCLFRSTEEVHAYAVTKGTIALQRDPENDVAVNLILKPLRQPIVGLTPVRYFVYRGLRLDEFLDGTSGAAAKRLRARAGSSPLIESIWETFLDLNPGETEVPATFLGYDPGQADADPLDDLFFRLDPDMQLPYVNEGTDLGRFHTASGGYDFGFEVMLHEGDYVPDLGYARKSSNEIDIGDLPEISPGEQFARRLEQEKILNFLDAAAFYGLHVKNGEVTAPGSVTHRGEDVYTHIVSRFATKNRLYLDIRSDNGNSLNFHRNYDDGSGNQVRIGDNPLIPAPKPYATEGWPILILDASVAVDTTDEQTTLYLQLRRGDNEKPVLYIDHGDRLNSESKFVGPSELGLFQWTDSVGFRHPNTGADGAKVGVAWLFRLFYGRQEVPVRTVPLPPTVAAASTYTDNVFGPIDRTSRWRRVAKMKWCSVQDNRYVDAGSTIGWRQMMRCGLAQETLGKSRTLLYAVATARDFEGEADFVPLRSVADGVSDSLSFFIEPRLFGAYLLEHDEVVDVDTATTIHTLRLRQHPDKGYPPSSALLLGLSKDETTRLQGLGSGLSKAWQRTVMLDAKTTRVDINGSSFDRYRVGVRGLKTADGTLASVFPSSDIHVYTVDGQLFASKAFAADEAPPEMYLRNYEEAMGTRTWPARERRIASVNAGAQSITIAQWDWRDEVFPGDKLKIGKSAGNDGEYTVDSVTLSGDDTVIVLSGGPRPLGTAAPPGSALTLPRNVEDLFIDRDQNPPTAGGIARMRVLVDQLIDDLDQIDGEDPAAKALILNKVNDIAPKILSRARQLGRQDRTHAADYERALYWTRLRITVAIKSHKYCVKAFKARNEILDVLERKSRGYELDFAEQPIDQPYVRILLTGFDPFQLDLNIERSNPSGAAALALHGKTIASSGKQGYVETAVFPVRYRDFDAGRVETLANKWLLPENPTPVDEAERATMIMTLSQNGGLPDFDLERFAGRRRSGAADNELVTQAPKQIGDATNQPFYQTTLKSEAMVPDTPTLPPHLFFDQSYKSTVGSSPDPRNGGEITNEPTVAFPTGEAVNGSGGAYLSNEIFYRVAHRRETVKSKSLTGHFHLPSTAAAHLGIGDIIAKVEEVIQSWLKTL